MISAFHPEQSAEGPTFASTASARTDAAGMIKVYLGGFAGEKEIRHNDSGFGHVIAVAEARLAAGRYQAALEWYRVVSSYAMTNPIGKRYGHRDRNSLRLRKLIARISRKIATTLDIAPWRTDLILLPWHRKPRRNQSGALR